jgi:protein ImuB
MSRIVSVWLKAWPIARLLRSQASAAPADAFAPRLDPDRPLVLVAPGKGSPRIVAVNRAAGQAGLVAGDLLSNARSKVLDLQARDADPAADAAALNRLALWAMRYAPRAAPWDEASGADGLFIDITGSAHLFGGEAQLLADLDCRLRAFGLVPRLAIADTPGVAWALARHGGSSLSTAGNTEESVGGSTGGSTGGRAAGLVLPSGAEADALRPLPIAALRLPEATLSLLRRLGLRRIGDVIDAPRAPLAARFEALLLRLDQALGRAPEPLVPAVPPPIYRAQAMFVEPIMSHEHVLEAATRLLNSLAADLARDAVGARVVRLMLFRVMPEACFQHDGGVQAVEVGLAAPSRDALHIARLIALRLERVAGAFDADFGFEAAALHVLAAEPLADRQTGLTMGETAAPPEALAQLIDRLQQRLGRAAVRQLHKHQSHIPERAVRAKIASLRAGVPSPLVGERQGRRDCRTSEVGLPPTPNPSPQGGGESARRLWGDSTCLSAAPRPLLLLPRPEPAEVVALIPEGPPRQFRWRGVRHQVAHAQGPERIAPEWWRQSPEEAERDYYTVEDNAGRRFWLYRAGRYGRDAAPPQWFMHGVFG